MLNEYLDNIKGYYGTDEIHTGPNRFIDKAQAELLLSKSSLVKQFEPRLTKNQFDFNEILARIE